MPEGNPPEKPGNARGLTRDITQRASMAQLLLVARLRARTRRDLAVDSLERAAHVIFVTCKNWFAASPDRAGQVPPAATGAPGTPPSDNNNKGPDAHRHD